MAMTFFWVKMFHSHPAPGDTASNAMQRRTHKLRSMPLTYSLVATPATKIKIIEKAQFLVHLLILLIKTVLFH